MKKMIHISCMVQWHQSCCVEKLEDACALMASAGSSVRLPATPTAIVLPAPPVAVVTPQGHQQTDRGLDPTETLQSGDVKSPDRADGVAATLEDTVFPDTPQEVTADFLSRMTGRAVKGFQLEILGMVSRPSIVTCQRHRWQRQSSASVALRKVVGAEALGNGLRVFHDGWGLA